MKRMITRLRDEQAGFFLPVTALFAALFLCGAVLGNGVALAGSFDTDGTLYSLFSEGNAAIFADPIKVHFFTVFFSGAKYHLLIFLLGFAGFGVFLIPLVIAAKGFFLAFSVASLYKLWEYQGFFAALLAFGPKNMISVPCLLLVGSEAVMSAAALLSYTMGKPGARDRRNTRYFFVGAGCILCMAMAALLEIALAPVLMQYISAR